MKDVDRETIEAGRPAEDTLNCINSCLEALYADTRRDSRDRFAQDMTYEELLGTLLLARDEIEAARTAQRESEIDQ